MESTRKKKSYSPDDKGIQDEFVLKLDGKRKKNISNNNVKLSDAFNVQKSKRQQAKKGKKMVEEDLAQHHEEVNQEDIKISLESDVDKETPKNLQKEQSTLLQLQIQEENLRNFL